MSTEQRHVFVKPDPHGATGRIWAPWTDSEWSIDAGSSGGALPHDVKWTWDPLRSGWHVTRHETRFVAVQGVKAGQWSWGGAERCHTSREDAQFSAGEYNKGRRGRDSGSIKRHDTGDWCVIDLHDLTDHRHRDTKPSNVTIVMGDSFADESPRQAAKRIRSEQEHRWSPHPESLGRGHVCTCGQVIATADVWKWDFSFKVGACNVAFAAYRKEPQLAPCANVMASWKGTNTPPRFQVRPAKEMRDGEPCWDIGSEMSRSHMESMSSLMSRGLADGDASERPSLTWRNGSTQEVAIIDTHSPEWKAFDAKHRPIKGERYEAIAYDEIADHPAVLPEIAKPKGPSDAEIVAQYERTMQDEVAPGLGWVTTDITKPRGSGSWALQVPWAGQCVHVPEADVRAAWSRELQRKQDEARETERQRVACQGDWPGENEFDA